MAQKPKKTRQKPSATAVAKKAGCSRQLAARLLGRGMTEAQIIARVADTKRREGGTMDLPVIPINGHAAGLPTYAESQTAKEYYLSQLRAIEVEARRKALLPLEPLRGVVFAATHILRNRLRGLPDELADEFGQEHTRVLRAHLTAILEQAEQVLRWEAERYGITLPPPAPPEVRRRLAYYERFLRDSPRGEIEVIPLSERIDSKEWRAAHPSITFEQTFRILASKRRWDQDMLDLMRRRSEWDLPSELPDEPPPEKAA